MKRLFFSFSLIVILLVSCACREAVGFLTGPLTGNFLLDDKVEELLLEICDADNTEKENLSLVYDWLCNELRYRAEPGKIESDFTDEIIISLAEQTLALRSCNYEGEAALTTVLFRRLGYDASIVKGHILKGSNGQWGDHAWVTVRIDGITYHFDPLYDSHYTEGDSKGCFFATDAMMELTHTWSPVR